MISMSREAAEKILHAFESDDWMQKMEASRILRSALKEQSLKPVAEVSAVDEYGPCFQWFDHWVDAVDIGTKFYAEK